MRNLYHATNVRNLKSIMEHGLLLSKCRFMRKRVWVCSKRRRPWSLMHVVQNHGANLSDVVILEVRVPRSWLGKHKPGLWFSRHDVPPARIIRVVPISEILS